MVIVIVVFSGIALNHTGGLRSDERRITMPWILAWYGMNPEGEPIASNAEGWALQWDDRLYWDGKLVAASTEPLMGAVSLGRIRVLATTTSLFLILPEGDLIERMDAPSLPPGRILEFGRLRDEVYLVTEEGRFLSQGEVSSWDRYQLAADVELAAIQTAPTEQREAALRSFRGQGVTLYRVLLDLHSGRLFGSVGVWIVDAAALVLLFLTLTGVWYALRVKRR